VGKALRGPGGRPGAGSAWARVDRSGTGSPTAPMCQRLPKDLGSRYSRLDLEEVPPTSSADAFPLDAALAGQGSSRRTVGMGEGRE
jgi:hypothetical protein